MLENSIDKKESIKKGKDYIIDLTKSCFKKEKSDSIIYSIRRVPYNMIMRMDLVSLSQYGTDEYTDLLLKYNDISNPFTLNYNDIIFIPSINTVCNDLIKPSSNDNGISDAKLIRNYHRHVDESKVPNTIGSEKNNIKIEKNYTEPNLAEEDSSPIVLRNGRIYFGNNSNVECSTNGISASDFAIQKIKNEL